MTLKVVHDRMPDTGEASIKIMGRFVGHAEKFGFAVPPVPLRFKLLQTSAHWTAFVQPTTDVSAAKIIEWLPATGLLRLEFGTRRVIRADFQPLPTAWTDTFRGVSLELARVEPEGDSSITLTGSRSSLAAFARRLFGPTTPLELVQLHAVHPPVTFLTLPQEDALRIAVAAGYYRIPRALNLEELGKKLGISSASLSERLRRAEGRIITRYIDAGSASPWDQKTLFEETHVENDPLDWPEGETLQAPSATPDQGRIE